jgi:two-component SAPR family response regulator
LLIEYASSRQPTKAFYTRLLREMREERLEPAEVQEEPAQPSRLATVEAYAFGAPRVLLNDNEISASEWQTAKSREMFFYLLLKPGWQHREAIVVDLWPEATAERGNRMFHITLHRLRQALYPGCVVQQGGMYRLNPLGRYSADVVDFQALVEKGSRSDPLDGKDTASLERALELYQGRSCQTAIPSGAWMFNGKPRPLTCTS